MAIQWWQVTLGQGANKFFVLEAEGRIASFSGGTSMVGASFQEFRESWESSGWKFERAEKIEA